MFEHFQLDGVIQSNRNGSWSVLRPRPLPTAEKQRAAASARSGPENSHICERDLALAAIRRGCTDFAVADLDGPGLADAALPSGFAAGLVAFFAGDLAGVAAVAAGGAATAVATGAFVAAAFAVGLRPRPSLVATARRASE